VTVVPPEAPPSSLPLPSSPPPLLGGLLDNKPPVLELELTLVVVLLEVVEVEFVVVDVEFETLEVEVLFVEVDEFVLVEVEEDGVVELDVAAF
jgi:hypothetical protein